MSHTPGPWRVDPEWGNDIQTEDGKLEIAKAFSQSEIDDVGIYSGVFPTDEIEVDANSRLIAAAPELLMCLKAMLTEFDDMCMVSGNARAARAAIAKAEGE